MNLLSVYNSSLKILDITARNLSLEITKTKKKHFCFQFIFDIVNKITVKSVSLATDHFTIMTQLYVVFGENYYAIKIVSSDISV